MERWPTDGYLIRRPRHPAAHRVALKATRSESTLDALAAQVFTSARHIQRLFIDETGLPFATWRTRARLNRAIVSLRSGEGLAGATRASGFPTKQGLLKALSRECDIPIERLARDTVAPFAEPAP